MDKDSTVVLDVLQDMSERMCGIRRMLQNAVTEDDIERLFP
jgi:hypothetical protein